MKVLIYYDSLVNISSVIGIRGYINGNYIDLSPSYWATEDMSWLTNVHYLPPWRSTERFSSNETYEKRRFVTIETDNDQ
jgi:hypothetical protein